MKATRWKARKTAGAERISPRKALTSSTRLLRDPDDRVLAFKNRVWHGPYRFEYYARAVCAGTFVVPPAKVAAMYSPEVWAPPPRAVS